MLTPQPQKPQQQQQRPPKLDTLDQKNLIIDNIREINVLRQEMLKDATQFSQELDDLEIKLIKRANELEILTSKEMGEISDKNLALVREFVNYQDHFIKKLENKHSNWEEFKLELSQIQGKLDEVMDRNELVPKLALIQVMEEEIEKLVEEVEELKSRKESKRRR